MRLFCTLLLTFVLSTALHAENVVLGLSKDEVAITANFDGSDILIFGAIKREEPVQTDTDLAVIVTLSGPSEPVTVRRKSNRFGIWVNSAAVEVDEAPSYYSIATSGPMDKVLKATEDLRYKVSVPQAIRSVGAPMDVEDSQNFTDALIRIRSNNNLYQLRENAVTLTDDTLFETYVEMPANLTEGDYVTRVLLTRDGIVISEFETTLDVRKVGLERWLYTLSRENPLYYGLLSLAIAIAAGWAASAVFNGLRRN